MSIMLYSNSTFFNLLIIAIPLVAVLAYVKWCFSYFKRHRTTYLKPTSIFGNLESLLWPKTAICIQFKQMYDHFKAIHAKCGGVYLATHPLLFINDLDLLKLILMKDFDHFTDRGLYYNEKDDPVSAHLFAIDGVRWRNLRVKVSPMFAAGKMKTMFSTLTECGALLKLTIDQKYATHEPIDVKAVSTGFAMDINQSCIFGLECNSFKDSNSPYRVNRKIKYYEFMLKLVKYFLSVNLPTLAKLLKVKVLRKETTIFFMKLVKDTVYYRKKEKIVGKDFLQMLSEIKYKNGDGNGKTLTIEEIAAECYAFFAAGFETSPTLITFALYELAQHPDIQDKVRREIVNVLKKHGDQITYESMNDLNYLNQVLDESLRKYPPVPIITRKCTRDYNVVDSDIAIKKGLMILIPVIGIHYDPDYYPDPEKFDPERFSVENKQSRHQYSFLPFGGGPRICFGKRFGLMQSKVAIVTLLKDYQVSLNHKTKQPLKMDMSNVFLSVDGGVWLDINKI